MRSVDGEPGPVITEKQLKRQGGVLTLCQIDALEARIAPLARWRYMEVFALRRAEARAQQVEP